MKNINVGYFAGIGYVASTIFSMFFVQHVIAGFHNKFMVLFIACVISTSFFTIINLRSMVKVLASLTNSWKLYAILSTLIGANWLCSIFGVIFSNAFLYGLGYFVFSASLAHLSNYLISKNKLSAAFFSASWIILLITLLINVKFTMGFIIALLGGATGYLYRRATIAFSSKECLTTTQIISARFYPLIFLLAFKFNLADLFTITQQQFYLIMSFGVIAFIIPTYLNQVAILKLGANESTIISAFIFPSSWFIDKIITHQVKLDNNFILSISAMLIIMAPVIMDRIPQKWVENIVFIPWNQTSKK